MDDNTENKNTNNSAQQGIFSTPELTVDAEKIAQNSEATNEASRAKIASIFASTETGQQAQRLNDAMEANSEPVTEDIVIDAGSKKKSKAPIIVAVVALVLVAVGVGAWFLMQNLGNQPKETPLGAFNNYLKLAQDGPENVPVVDAEASTNNTTTKWFLLRIANAGLQKSETKEYLDKVKQAYETFYKLYSVVPNAQTNLANTYRSVLLLYINLNNLMVLTDTLAAKYLDDSPNAAYNYIQSFSRTDEMTSLEEDGMEQLKLYLEAELSMLSIADTNDCIIGGTFDDFCRTNLAETSTAYQEALSKQQAAGNRMAGISTALGKLLQDQASILQERISNGE